MWTIKWQPGKAVTAATAVEIEHVLDTLQRETAGNVGVFVEIIAPNKDAMAIGLSKRVGVLSFMRGTGDPHYLSSAGDDPGDEVMVFRYMGEWTEISQRKTLPIEKAREAVRYFLTTGTPSPEINWEED